MQVFPRSALERRDGREVEAVCPVESQPTRDEERVVDEAPVPDRHALGHSRRSRGVDDVGQVFGRPPTLRVRRGLFLERGPVEVEPEDMAAEIRHAVGERSIRHQHGRPRLGELERQPGLGLIGVDRHIGPPGLEDAQEPDDHPRGTVEAEPHRDPRPDPEAAEAVGELIGAGVQPGIGQFLALEDQGEPTRRPAGLLLEQVVQAGLARVIGGRLVEARLLDPGEVRVHHFQARDRRRRIPRSAIQERREEPREVLDFLDMVGPAVVPEAGDQRPLGVLDRELESEGPRMAVELRHGPGRTGHLARRRRFLPFELDRQPAVTRDRVGLAHKDGMILRR